jgi:hypothetical protein
VTKRQPKPEMITMTYSTSAFTIMTNTTTATTSKSLDYMTRTKIENATEGLPYTCFNYLFNRVLPASKGKENALTICDYMSCLKSEINPSDHYRKDTIILLCNISTFFKNAKSFKEITREDLLSFLERHL